MITERIAILIMVPIFIGFALTLLLVIETFLQDRRTP